MKEAEARAEHIDSALKAAGWGAFEGSRIRRYGWKLPTVCTPLELMGDSPYEDESNS